MPAISHPCCIQDLEVSVLLSVVPLVRILKLLRRFQKFLLLQNAFADVAEACVSVGLTTAYMYKSQCQHRWWECILPTALKANTKSSWRDRVVIVQTVR